MAFGSGLVGWAPVPEELIEGSTGADRMCDQRFDGGDSLVGVHVQLLALQPDSSAQSLRNFWSVGYASSSVFPVDRICLLSLHLVVGWLCFTSFHVEYLSCQIGL